MAEMNDKKAWHNLVFLAVILSIAILLWSADVDVSRAVGASNPGDSVLHTLGGNSPGVSLTAGWNLISLPIMPFNTSIESVLAPLAFPYDLISIWHYDRCADEWLVYGNGHSTLKTMEAGKAYWVRMRYPEEQDSDPAISGEYPYALWVFGTKAAMPPDLPSAHEVCPGWNMVGFRSTEEMPPEDYLRGFSPSEYGAIYGWDPHLQEWITNPDKLVPGRGYWIPFSVQGTIYP